MKLITATQETITLHLSNEELETIVSAHIWAQGGLEELLTRHLEEGHTKQINEEVEKIYIQLRFLHSLEYVRKGR